DISLSIGDSHVFKYISTKEWIDNSDFDSDTINLENTTTTITLPSSEQEPRREIFIENKEILQGCEVISDCEIISNKECFDDELSENQQQPTSQPTAFTVVIPPPSSPRTSLLFNGYNSKAYKTVVEEVQHHYHRKNKGQQEKKFEYEIQDSEQSDLPLYESRWCQKTLTHSNDNRNTDQFELVWHAESRRNAQQWINYDDEQNQVKFLTADIIFDQLLQEMLNSCINTIKG
ncbi:unnamed protein product, partial [Didymodactylos carnosus]